MARPSTSDENSTGARSVLSLAGVYRFAQRAIGAERFRQVFVAEQLRPDAHDRILDVGCGTADIVEHLGEVDYVGFDPNPRYVDGARERFGDRGRFVVSTVADFDADTVTERSIVMAIGVLHHLSDADAAAVLDLARSVLGPDGRFVSVDPTLTDDQHRVARFLVTRDRGQHVRTPERTRELVDAVFDDVRVEVRHDLLRTPYSHVIVQAAGPR